MLSYLYKLQPLTTNLVDLCCFGFFIFQKSFVENGLEIYFIDKSIMKNKTF